ncbi:hypothetical protein F383_35939 [Gossypium arboreum]|uniref:Uncharacterized protein n=1 Tax=Gossypium arboreum TaxID=29729 RepID=A0A0B0PYL5_GOSAR|nr:hypothetical protein F383_35939 [Gossypium arboreum]
MDPHGKSTWLGLPHTDVHNSVPLEGSKHDLHGVSRGHVSAEPKYNPIRKRPILRALRHSKAYLNT